MVPPHVRLAKGTVLDRRFVVERVLGQGGMGIVIAARHQTLRKTVAIKMMRPEYSGTPELAQRFLREARAAARLRSEHVVRVTDVDVFASGVPYFIMEYSPGIDLAKHLELHGPLPVPLVLELLLQTLEALAEAHRAGIVHRDLKPANLLLTTREDDSPSIKVLDFGISKCSEASVGGKLTALGSMLGSPVYMAPEQIRDASTVDARADIWSIGVVGYELLTGKQPFVGRTPQATIAAICSEEPPPLPASVPPLLAEVLAKCLARRADDRFQTVADLARALAPLSDDLGPRLSIERILRRRSSAPPPPVRAEREQHATTVADAGPPELVSLPPYERDSSARPRSLPHAAARFRARLTAGVALCAVLSLWLFLRGGPPESGQSPVGHAANRPKSAAVSLPPAVAPPVELTASEPSARFQSAVPLPLPVPAVASARRRNKPPAGAARDGLSGVVVQGFAAPASGSFRAAPLRKLDHENPFAP
jgi:eukaryotic-like serine/threonine-protein kinase